jgi:branched-subunit amino acid transport protein
MQRLIDATAWIRERHATDDAAVRGAATQYLRLFALAIIACMWTKTVVTARDRDGNFYDVKRKLARFYAEQLLPETASLLATIIGGDAALADFEIADFSD